MHVQAFDMQWNVTHHHFPGKAGTYVGKENDQWTQNPFKGRSILFAPDAKSTPGTDLKGDILLELAIGSVMLLC